VSYEAEERAKATKKLHQQIQAKIEKTNGMYKVRENKHYKALTFKREDVVWSYLRKKRLPSHRRNELMLRGDGPFKVLEKVKDNAYKIELSGHISVSPTLNVSDLTPYLKNEDDGCNAPNPRRVRTVTITITIKKIWNERTEFPLKLDHTQLKALQSKPVRVTTQYT